MQLVNTIDISFESQLSIGQKVHGLAGALSRQLNRIWDRLREALPETSTLTFPAARTPIDLAGYYGGAYDRLTASMPIVSCVACVGVDPFPPTSSRGTVVAKKPYPEPRHDGKEDTWRAVLLAHLESPALMI